MSVNLSYPERSTEYFRDLYLAPPKALNILIIDDDVDTALQVQSIFAHLGCETICTLDWNEARKKICSLKPDIIILDWMLDNHIDGGDIVRQCNRTFEKFAGERRTRALHPSKIITYSSLLESEIDLPSTPYFDHLDHWQKPIQQRDLLLRALRLLKSLGR